MNKSYIDNEGKKVVNGVFTSLVEATEEHMLRLETDSNEREKLLSLTPSLKEITKAETELQIITLLQEVELI